MVQNIEVTYDDFQVVKIYNIKNFAPSYWDQSN
jgi:hypothetical protein